MRLQPFDVVLGLRLLKPVGTLADIAAELNVVPSQVHSSLQRLELAGLVRPGTREANRHNLAEFIEHGVRYAFPATIGRQTIGVPTAHSAPLLAKDISSADAFVWAAPKSAHIVRGFQIAPLYAGAVELRETSPSTYQLVALVDALRVGQARERKLALEHLRKAFERPRPGGLRDDIAKRRTEILAAAAENGAKDVRVFGSVARGDDTPDSDIDFLVTLEPGRTLLDLAQLEIRLEQLLGRKVDVVTERSIQDPIRAEIARDAIRV